MSEYRRWISYIYAYENGEKKQNTGYARLELRNGRVRISVYMDAKPEQEEINLCCYKVQGEKCEGVRLGTFRMNTGKEEFKAELEADNLAGSGLLFVEMSGLLFFNRPDMVPGRYFASSWEEEPLKASQAEGVVKFLQGSEEEKTKEADFPTKTVKEEEGMLKGFGNLQKENFQNERMLQQKWEMIEDSSLLQVTEKEAKDEMKKAVEEVMPEVEERAKEKIEERAEKRTTEKTDEEMEIAAGVQATEEKQLHKKEEGFVRNPCCTEGRENRPFCCLEPMYPFEDGEFDRSVRMEPQDIGLLPRTMWKYAGNSFLLHGFYTYHHLLLTRKRGKDGDTCYLLIPGTYGTKEQHMAQMFGFRHFKCLKRKTLENGDFGYWYLEIPKNQSF